MSIRPAILDEIIYELRETLQATHVFKDGATKNCVNCVLFDEKTELCKKFNQRPPARVIALSCEHHEDCNDIPF